LCGRLFTTQYFAALSPVGTDVTNTSAEQRQQNNPSVFQNAMPDGPVNAQFAVKQHLTLSEKTARET